MENFPKDIPNSDRAKQIIAEWNQEIQLKLDSYGSNKIIDSNPGFETIIKTENIDETVVIVNNVNDIEYLKSINIFINSLFKIILNRFYNEIKGSIFVKKIPGKCG